MTPTTEKIQPPPRNNKLAKRGILILILLVFLLLTARTITSAHSSFAPILGNLLGTPGLTPTNTATATSTSKLTVAKTATATATSTSKPTATKTATATATRTSTPTATKTWAPTSNPQTIVKVSYSYVNLRTGPGNNFAVVRQLTLGELLMLLGRLSDNTWVYVKTSDGQEGWIRPSWVNLAGINLDYHPIETPPPPPETTVKVSSEPVNLHTGPGINYVAVQKLTFGEVLMLLGRSNDNTWLYVKTSDGQEGWVRTTWVDLGGIDLVYDYHPVKTSPPTETSTPVVLAGIEGHWIDLDLSEQRLRAYEGTKLVGSFLVSTGTYLYPTEIGQYRIYVKRRYTDMHGHDYFLPDVPFTMFYSGDFSIHGTYWHHNFGTPMSHGCVNMDTKDAEWLYYWASLGTLVNIHY